MKIDNYGKGERGEATLRLLLRSAEAGEVPARIERIILLPIPTTRDGVNISGTDIKIGSLPSEILSGDLVAGYGIPSDVCDGIAFGGGWVYDAAKDEQFLTENAELTALGTLGYILTSEQRSIGECCVGVVGYGRIGKVLLRYLLFFGARVRVFSNREAVRDELCGYGVSTAPIFSDGKAPDFSGVDILINTAPTSLCAGFAKGRVPDNMRVIELASGNNFDGVLGVEALPGVPGKMYPKSAGRAYFNGIMRYIREATV